MLLSAGVDTELGTRPRCPDRDGEPPLWPKPSQIASMLDDLLGETAHGLLRGLGRLLAPLGRFLVELLVHFIGELLIQGTGYAICQRFKADVSPDGWLSTLVGLLFWTVIGLGAWYLLASMPTDGSTVRH